MSRPTRRRPFVPADRQWAQSTGAVVAALLRSGERLFLREGHRVL